MNLVKCPRCDLNYILDTEKYCKVCLREMKGLHSEDELELCSVCNAAPALPGKDVCLSCLKEMNGTLSDDPQSEEEGVIVDESALGMEDVSEMDEIMPEDDEEEDMPSELADDEEDEDGDLSLESVIEDEEANEEDGDSEEDDR